MVFRASVLAAIVRLLELTLFRDGIANMSAQWNLWYEDVALPPFSDPGKYIRLTFRGKIGIHNKEFQII